MVKAAPTRDECLQRPSETATLALARETGQRVEVTPSRTKTDQVFANPSGTFTIEEHTSLRMSSTPRKHGQD